MNSETPLAKMSGTKLKLLFQIEQLKQEVALKREPVSVTIQGLIDFCEKNKNEDALLNGLDASENPFIEKSKCCTLQ